MTGFVVARNNRAGRRQAGAWWQACEQARAPYVQIAPRSAYAAVELDMLPSGRRLPAEAIEELRRLGMACQALPYWVCVGATFTAFQRVPIRQAEAVAMAMLALAMYDQDGIMAECETIAAEAWGV